jgi:hypothetical protein
MRGRTTRERRRETTWCFFRFVKVKDDDGDDSPFADIEDIDIILFITSTTRVFRSFFGLLFLAAPKSARRRRRRRRRNESRECIVEECCHKYGVFFSLSLSFSLFF